MDTITEKKEFFISYLYKTSSLTSYTAKAVIKEEGKHLFNVTLVDTR